MTPSTQRRTIAGRTAHPSTARPIYEGCSEAALLERHVAAARAYAAQHPPTTLAPEGRGAFVVDAWEALRADGYDYCLSAQAGRIVWDEFERAGAR